MLVAGLFNCSIAVVSPPGPLPVESIAALEFPCPPPPYLAVDRSAISEKEDPFHNSVRAEFAVEYPPKTTVSVLVPCAEAERILLAVFKSPTSVHVDPFHDSLLATLVGGGLFPAEYKAAVAIP